MAVKVVTGKLTNAANVPIGYATVSAILSAQAVITSTQEIASTVPILGQTGPDGTWSLSLESNLDLTPNTTYYTIAAGSWSATVVVQSGAGPFKVEDIMATPPVVSPPGALDSQVVHLANPETITGVKHFSGGAAIVPSLAAPSSPVNGEQYRSSSLLDMRVGAGVADRNNILPSGTNGAVPTPQEVSVWYANGIYNMILTDNNLAYRSCSGDPTVAANWSARTQVIGGGSGGFAGTPAHSGVLVDGANLYCYYTDTGTGNVRVASAALSAPTVWADQGIVLNKPGTSSTGNVFVVKDGNTYRLFVEFIQTVTGNGSVSRNLWNTGMATSSTPTGTFTMQITTLQSLRTNGGNGTVSGIWIGKEGSNWVAFYHSQAGAPAFPDHIYRAYTTDLGTDAWTIDLAGNAFIHRVHPVEVDQCADPFLCQTPGGTWLMFWEGCDNRTQKMSILCAPLQSALKQWDGGFWHLTESGYDQSDQEPPEMHPWMMEMTKPYDGVGFIRTGTWNYDAGVGDFGVRFYNSSNTQNDSIQWDVILAPGTWKFSPFFLTGNNMAIATLDIDDGAGNFFFSPIQTFDNYAVSSSQFQYHIDFTVYGHRAMRRQIRLKAATRNASSVGWGLQFFNWTLIRTDT